MFNYLLFVRCYRSAELFGRRRCVGRRDESFTSCFYDGQDCTQRAYELKSCELFDFANALTW